MRFHITESALAFDISYTVKKNGTNLIVPNWHKPGDNESIYHYEIKQEHHFRNNYNTVYIVSIVVIFGI